MTPELLQTLLQVGGTPALIAVVLYWAWTSGPKAEVARIGKRLEAETKALSDTMKALRDDMQQGRERIYAEQERTRERLHRIEVLMEIEAIRSNERASRRRRDDLPLPGGVDWSKERGGG